MNIIKCCAVTNTTACSRTPQYIVIHYTAGTTSKVGTAKNTAVYFSKSSTKASADFIVDDGSIVQYNTDPTKRYCWSVGGSKWTQKYTSESGKYYGKVTNVNSISIEMCSNKTNKKSLNATDTDWYITEATINNAVECCKYLMSLYNIPINNVVTHHGITGKLCPQPFVINEAALQKWYNFKRRLNGTSSSSNITSTSSVGTSTTNIGNSKLVVSKFSPIKGNSNDFVKIVKNLKLALNTDYGLKFNTNNADIDTALLTNLANVQISKGTDKENVTYVVQQLLRWWGYTITIDGDFGSNTLKIVKTFQKQVNITENGITTADFWKKILGK
jgi:N-acetylmuramoyl-L-alanine amidase CwlA